MAAGQPRSGTHDTPSPAATDADGSAGPEPRRWFFVHVLKAAGTDLFTRLGGDPTVPVSHTFHFSEPEVYPNRTDGDVFTVAPQLSVDQLLARWTLRRPEIRIIMGHFPLCTTELLDAPFVTISALRDPVERTLSFLRHHRKLTPADRDRPLEEIYEDPFRFEALIHNHMTKMFGIDTTEMDAGMLTAVDLGPDHLSRAKANVDSLDVVGVQERFEDFCAELTRRFGWDLGPALHANRTAPVPVDPSFRRRIAADNALDIELFEHAQRVVERRAAEQRRSFA
ncbi:MAG: hypothetical protein JJU45_06145 [Acidimicrobiia bacterium]|nr:hypothetical protein [Acidimicrobiia bacterium]